MLHFYYSGIKRFINEQKKRKVTELKDWHCASIVRDNEVQDRTMEREQAFINLAIINSTAVNEVWQHSERDYHLNARYDHNEFISIDEIITEDDMFVCLCGIAGIGKSFLIETMMYLWANGSLFAGVNKSPKVDVLLNFTCREINLLSPTVTLEKLFQSFYGPQVSVKMLQDISDISDRVLIVVDGLDEWRNINNFRKDRNSTVSPLNKTMYDLINTTSVSLLSGHRTIVVGRPQACNVIESVFSRETEIKSVENIGFMYEDVQRYVASRFADDMLTRNLILQRIEESQTLKSISIIPVYLWIICGLYGSDKNFPTPETATSLLIYTCLFYLRDHFKSSEHGTYADSSIYELVNDKRILEMIIDLASLSHDLYRQGKVMFYEDDLQSAPFQNLQLEESGFVVKKKSDLSGNILQFQHMVLLEFFTALHIFLNSGVPIQELEDKYNACMPTISGFEGLISATTKDIPKRFVVNVMNIMFPSATDVAAVGRPSYGLVDHYFNTLELEYLNIGDQRFKLFLAMLFENNLQFPATLNHEIRINAMNCSHQALCYLMHFLDLLDYQVIVDFNISFKDQCFTLKEVKKLTSYFLHSIKVKIWSTFFPAGSFTYISSGIINVNRRRELVDPTDECNADKSTGHCILEELCIANCKVTDEDVIKLSPCIVYLKKLSLREKKNISGASLTQMSDVIIQSKGHCKLEVLDLSYCNLHDEDVIKLSPCITYLKELNLGGNENLSGASLTQMSDVIIQSKGHCKLEKLNLSYCNLHDEDVIKLSPCITYLKNLCLHGNKNLSGASLTQMSDVIIQSKGHWIV